ncbi:MAG: FAD-binding oxidoreductase [Bacteroidetes bacterium]|nr:FAD-binding oxidoreductase [Bacteroidota bacterium]
MLSYWERQSFTGYDHIVVGSGIVGLSVAIELKERFPKARVLVLERGLLPTGATTRNAGFACMGSASELLADLENQEEEVVAGLFLRRKAGLDLLRQRLSDDDLGYRADGGFELLGKEEVGVLDRLDYLNALLRPLLGCDAFLPAHARIGDFGFPKNQVAGLIENTCEGSLDSGKMMHSLLLLAMSRGVELKTGAEVLRFEKGTDSVTVAVQDAFRREALLLKSKTLSICTNAFAAELLPTEDVTPGRGQVLITEPIAGLRIKGIFHYDAGYYYFRELDGRVLIGGGRNLDFEAERTTEFALTTLIQEDLERKLRELILPGQDFKIAMRWAGIMAFGPTKAPIVKAFNGRVFGAFRMGGMGVALGSQAAKELVALIVRST